MQNIATIVCDVAAETTDKLQRGQVATYTPPLAVVSPAHFGVAVIEMDGMCHLSGDAELGFSVQSTSKIFALTLWTKSATHCARVGHEPSGTAFISIILFETDGIPRNAFLNAGAIVVADVLLSRDRPRDVLAQVWRIVRELAEDDTIARDETVARVEQWTGFVNRALANYMCYSGALHHDHERVLGVYVHQSALVLSCRQLAMAGRLLILDGRNPANGFAVVSSRRARRINAVIEVCGDYDGSGEFALRVGMPGKSGGILAIVPRRASIAVWSPGLNNRANSHLGMLALECLVHRPGWSVFGPRLAAKSR